MHGLWWAVLLLSFALGLGLLWYFNLPYERAHAALVWLSPTHRWRIYTPAVYAAIQPVGKILAGGLVVMGMSVLIFPRRTRVLLQRAVHLCKDFLARVPLDFLRLWKDLWPHGRGWRYVGWIGLLTLGAALVRWLFLSLPLGHDESYTIMVFSRQSWLGVISDYHLPNNHIFHSLLVKLSSLLLGTQPWAERFPAFLAGVLCVPAAYWTARQMYGRSAAVFSAGLVAALPMLIDYSSNARGYSLYTLFSLLLFGLAFYLRQNVNLVGWGVFVLIATLGFYTVPFMLYPFGAVCVWLLASAAIGDTTAVYQTFWRLAKYVFLAGAATVLFSILLYAPVVLVGTGLDSLVGNSFVARLSWSDLWPTLGERIRSTWTEWNYDVPVAVRWLLAGGVGASLLLHRKISRIQVPTQAALMGWIFVLVVVQRGDPLTRLWSFLMPFWLIWAAGGWIVPLTRIKPNGKRIASGVVLAALLVTASWSLARVHRYFPQWQPGPGQIELTADYIAQNFHPGDAVAVVSPDDAPLWYYLDQFGIPDEAVHQIEQGNFERVFVVVNAAAGETSATVLESHHIDPLAYPNGAVHPVQKFENLEIYLCAQ